MVRAGGGRCSPPSFSESRTVGLDGRRIQDVQPWVTFAGCVLVVVVLYWAQAVLVPIARAILLTFALTPPVTWLERWVGGVRAVLVVVTLVFALLGLAGWGLARQMTIWREAGANHVAPTPVDTRDYLGGLVEMPRVPVPHAAGVHAA